MKLATAVCELCGRRPIRALLTGDDRLFCAVHPWCQDCATAHFEPCVEATNPVVEQGDAVRQAVIVLGQLAGLGIDLPTVPLSLVSTLPPTQKGRCFKTAAGGVRSARIEILTGQGPTRFGHCVVHEHVHALLHLEGRTGLDPALEEGVCEMVAMVWLSSRPTSPPLRRHMWANPDPVYGEQMRRVVGRARQVGVPTLLTSVLQHGALP